MNTTKKILFFATSFFIATTVNAKGVLVAHPITTGIAEMLLKDTYYEVISAVPKRYPASRQLHYLETRGKEPLVALSEKSDVAITAKSIYAKDYLYPMARRSNINIIPVDIAQPIDGEKSGVAKLKLAIDEHAVWLNPNSLRIMMTIFSDEMKRLKQTDNKTATIIDSNLQKQQRILRTIVMQMQDTLDKVEDEPVALVLDAKLSYFLQGLQLQYYIADGKNMSNEEFSRYFDESDVSLVITSKKITKEQHAILDAKGGKLLTIKRLKATNPVEQLAKIYTAAQALISP